MIVDLSGDNAEELKNHFKMIGADEEYEILQIITDEIFTDGVRPKDRKTRNDIILAWEGIVQLEYKAEMKGWDEKECNQALILEAMKRANDNQSIAARLLGITPQILNAHLKRSS